MINFIVFQNVNLYTIFWSFLDITVFISGFVRLIFLPLDAEVGVVQNTISRNTPGFNKQYIVCWTWISKFFFSFAGYSCNPSSVMKVTVFTSSPPVNDWDEAKITEHIYSQQGWAVTEVTLTMIEIIFYVGQPTKSPCQNVQ